MSVRARGEGDGAGAEARPVRPGFRFYPRPRARETAGAALRCPAAIEAKRLLAAALCTLIAALAQAQPGGPAAEGSTAPGAPPAASGAAPASPGAAPVAPGESDAARRRDALAALSSGDARARLRAIVALANLGLEEDAPPLLDALHDRDPEVREAANAAVWQVWSRSGDAQTDRLLALGIEQMSNGDYRAADDTFSRVIERRPQFAEGWNKRATVRFLAGDYRASLADCDEVVRRNPRHFGALAGYGQIYIALGQLERALEYFRRALAINPTMEGVATNVELLEALIARRRGRGV